MVLPLPGGSVKPVFCALLWRAAAGGAGVRVSSMIARRVASLVPIDAPQRAVPVTGLGRAHGGDKPQTGPLWT